MAALSLAHKRARRSNSDDKECPDFMVTVWCVKNKKKHKNEEGYRTEFQGGIGPLFTQDKSPE